MSVGPHIDCAFALQIVCWSPPILCVLFTICPLVPTLNCVKLEDCLLVPVTIHTICMVLFMPTKTVGTHAATCDRVVLVFFKKQTLKLSQRVFDIKSPGSCVFNMVEQRDLHPKALKLVRKSVSVKIGKFIKIGIGIGMLFLLEEKNRYWYVIYFTESLSVIVRIGIG